MTHTKKIPNKRNTNWTLVVLCSLLVILVVTSIGIIGFSGNSNKAVENLPRLSHEEFMAEADKLASLAREQSPKEAFAYLEQAIKTNSALARDCHPLLHHLGHTSYEKYTNFTSAIEYQNELCNSGYTHGLIESHFSNSTDIEKTLRETCVGQESNTYRQWQCHHGVGHGVMYFTEKDVTKSVELCRSLSGELAIDSCINGVFMERFIAVDHTGHQVSKLPMEPTICEAQEENLKTHCYLYAPSAFLSLNPNKYNYAIKLCEKVKSHTISCMRGVGMQTMKENITDTSIAKSVCEKAPKNLQGACVQGAVSLYIFHSGSTSGAAERCDSTFKKHQQSCQKEVEIQKEAFSI